MCFPRPRQGSKEDGQPLNPVSPARSDSDHQKKKLSNESKAPMYFPESVPHETKPEQVQHRLGPVIQNLFYGESPTKAGGSSDLLATKLAKQNKLDEAKDLNELTCEEDCNYYNIRKDILAIVDKTKTTNEDDTIYDDKKKKVKCKDPSKKVKKVKYQKDARQSKSIEEKPKPPVEKPSKETTHDSEKEVNEKNFMYNLKEIDYCTHDMMRCVEEDNLNNNVSDDSKLPKKVEPYGDLEQLVQRGYSTCKVLRRNTLISTLCSMPSADENEIAATATAKHMSEHCAIRFLPPTTLLAHCEDAREDQTNIDMSDLAGGSTALAINASGPARTAIDIAPVGDSSRKKKKKEGGGGGSKQEIATCESERKTAEEM